MINSFYSTTDKNIPKGFHAIEVGAVTRLTDKSVLISFLIPDSLCENFRFKPGQNIDIILLKNGHQIRRTYSICSSQVEPLSIAVKAIPNGEVSPFINTSVTKGSVLLISEPKGSFLLNESVQKIVLIGAGSGITPLFAIIKSAIKKGIQTTLIYGNRLSSSTMFKNELSEIKELQKFYFFSGEKIEGHFWGRIDMIGIQKVVALEQSIKTADAYYVCGPGSMIKEVKSVLMEMGIHSDKINSEYFEALPSENTIANNKAQGNAHVTVRLDGEKYNYFIGYENSDLLEGSIKAGIDAPFSCKTGVCGSCRAKVIIGGATMKSNYALTNDEVSDGYILTCQALPSTPTITISYDE
jgi:ring-1,2-phenylacetyl-CoA epoxidase subunit PaaE